MPLLDIMTEDSTKPLLSDNRACSVLWNPVDQPVVQSLVRSLEVIVLHVLRDRPPEVSDR